jgi:ParB family transcriptional regulator, chromosome partitioning protein
MTNAKPAKKTRMHPDEKKTNFLFGTSPDIPRIVEIDLAQISPNPNQPRKTINEEHIKGLAASIASHGLLHPVTLRKRDDSKGYYLVAGECRLRAHQLLRKQTIFAIITKSHNPDELALIENIQRSDLSALEEAEAYARLMERYGYTQEELGKVVGKAQNTMSEVLRVNTLPDSIKEEYRTPDTRVSRSVLLEIARLNTPDEQLELWDQVKQGANTVRAVRQAKKGKTASRNELTPTAQVLAAGRAFARKLSQIPPEDLTPGNEQYADLMELSEQILALVSQLKALPHSKTKSTSRS